MMSMLCGKLYDVHVMWKAGCCRIYMESFLLSGLHGKLSNVQDMVKAVRCPGYVKTDQTESVSVVNMKAFCRTWSKDRFLGGS